MEDQRTTVVTTTSTTEPPLHRREPRAPRSSPVRRSRLWFVGLIVLALGGIAGAAYYFRTDAKSEKATEDRDEHSGDSKSAGALPVEAVHPQQGGIERRTTQAGSVHAFDYASLYAKVSGYLKVQNVDIGDRVKRGDLLAVIDDPEVDEAVKHNKAALDQAQAKVKVAEAKIRSAQAAQQAAQALVKQSETMVIAKLSNEDLQRKQLLRVHSLVERNAVEKKLEDEQQDRYDVSRADVGVTRAEVLSAQAQVMNKAAMVEEAQADLIEAQANVEVARANLNRAKVMQDYTRITSPYDGIVTKRSFHRGDFIRSASEGGNIPVLAVAVTDKMRIVVPVPDTDVPFVTKGDKASFQIVALPGKSFTGTVARFSETEDPESRNMRTEIDMPNLDGILREGMYGRVTIVLQAAAPNSVTIPSSGLLGQTGSGEGSVYVVKDGKAHKVNVKVGNDNGVETEILSGLTPDDQVITSYNGPIAEGTSVKAEMAKAAKSDH